MRAKFINEKFTDKSDPITDMGIGYKVNLKSIKILEFIGSKGENGASFTEIQHYIWVKLNKRSEESFWEKGNSYDFRKHKNRKIRQSRGYWTDGLYGGLLAKYCKKNPINHKWVLVRMPRYNENIFFS